MIDTEVFVDVELLERRNEKSDKGATARMKMIGLDMTPDGFRVSRSPVERI